MIDRVLCFYGENTLAHGRHKYKAKRWIRGKWRYFYNSLPNFVTGSEYLKEGQQLKSDLHRITNAAHEFEEAIPGSKKQQMYMNQMKAAEKHREDNMTAYGSYYRYATQTIAGAATMKMETVKQSLLGKKYSGQPTGAIMKKVYGDAAGAVLSALVNPEDTVFIAKGKHGNTKYFSVYDHAKTVKDWKNEH